MGDIFITEGVSVKRGNLSEMAKLFHNPYLEEYLFHMEGAFYTDWRAFILNMRIALEGVAKIEFARLYPPQSAEDPTPFDRYREDTLRNAAACNPYADRITGWVKLFFILNCCQPEYTACFSRSYEALTGRPLTNPRGIRKLITRLYSTGSAGAHFPEEWMNSFDGFPAYAASDVTVQPGADADIDDTWLATPEERWRLYETMYYFLRGYCLCAFPENREALNSMSPIALLPRKNYIPLTNRVMRDLQFKNSRGKKYYIREENGAVQYYLTIDRPAGGGGSTEREIRVLKRIWDEENLLDPVNIIRLREKIRLLDGSEMQVFSLPSAPKRLTPEILAGMSQRDKSTLFQGALRSIRFLHESVPPLYHRDITPDAFILCQVKNGYKLFLDSFEYMKVTDAGSLRSAGAGLEEKREDKRRLPYLAPEAHYEERPDDGAFWEKVDLYALGILGVFLFTGDTDPCGLENCAEIDEGLKTRILALCSTDPQARPSLV